MPDQAAAPIPPLLLIGCGRMGRALLRSWQAEGLAPSMVVDPADAGVAAPHRQVAGLDQVPEDFAPAAVVLAVKPQMADRVLAGLASRFEDAVMLSIMAGRTINGLSRQLGQGTALVRAMPNTPAAIGRGISVACAGAGVTGSQRALCDRLLAATGETAWVEDEALLDPVTAVSGSGPAYVFLLAELLERAGIEQGLPAPLARQLARATVSGSGALLDASPDEDASALRRAVTSPAGTTEAALAVLMDAAAWPAAIRTAVEAATRRSRALAS